MPGTVTFSFCSKFKKADLNIKRNISFLRSQHSNLSNSCTVTQENLTCVTGAKRDARGGIHEGDVLQKVEGSHCQHGVRQNRHEDNYS